VSPLAAQVQSTFPLVGSTPCNALFAATSSCFFPAISAMTGVLWAKPTVGRRASQAMSPVFLSKAIRRDCLSNSSHWRMTVSPNSTGLAASATSNLKGFTSFRQSCLPSWLSAASTLDPNTTYTRSSSAAGVGAV